MTNQYALINTETSQIIRRGCTLTPKEAEALNYAFALNQAGKKYLLASSLLSKFGEYKSD